MADKQYIDYLTHWLMYSSEDYCQKCGHFDKENWTCPNMERMNDEMCKEGLRLYAERQK